MRAFLATAATAAFLAATPLAGASQRYASPSGSGEACSKEAPCSLQAAITKAASNDEVIVTAGTYSVSAPMEAAPGVSNVYVHGDFSAPMPHIAATVENVPFRFEGPGERYSYLDIVNQGLNPDGLLCYGSGSTIERVRTFAIGEYARGAFEGANCKVRDSLIRAEGTYSAALGASGGIGASPESALARNVTALATGTESFGVEVTSDPVGGGSMTLDLKNAIVSGDGADLVASGLLGPANILVTNSNFDSAKPFVEGTITGSPNQTTPPLFVNASGGDYREAAGSPTIDAGSTDQIGPLDLEGNPRNQGAAPDIGAFEFASPPSPPPPPSAIESLSIKPKAFRTVNAGGAVISRTKGSKTPIGTTVSYALSTSAMVSFSVERATGGRRVGKRCVKQTGSNSDHKRCTRFLPGKGSFSVNGAAGANQFKFSGRLNGKALKPGSYRLVGQVGDSVQRARFEIVG